MTLALSSCCSDGVTIIEDTRIYKPFAMEKDKISYSEKLRGVILNVIFGYSGVVWMYDLFVRYVVGDFVYVYVKRGYGYGVQNRPKSCVVVTD